MASTNEAIERLSFQAVDTGIDQVTAKLTKLAATQGTIAVSASSAEKATGTYEGRLASIQSKYDALTRQQAAYTKALNDNTAAITNSSNSMVAANDNAAKSFTVMGIEVAEAANHLRVAGEAAYFFSPAFRSVVNGLAAPALGLASTALTAIAAGIVTATNVAGRGLVAVGLAAARSSEALVPLGGAIATAGASMAAFNPSIAGVAGSILTKLLPALKLLGLVGLAVDVVKLYFEAWELGGKKLEEWRQIAEKAAAVDLSTSFFQKITKYATDAKLPVDELTASMKKLAEVTAEKLGGSDLQNRLDQLTKAGNFQGNTGVGQLASANTTEEKFRSIVSLTDQAFAKGERLAALDLTSKFLSPAAQSALTKDSEYLHNMLDAADKLNSTQIVSDADVGRALDLQRRYDAAVAILEQRWHPIQDLLTAAGIKMHEAWVGIVEAVAGAFDGVTKLVMKIGEIGQPFWDFVKKGVNVAATAVATVAPYNPLLGPAVGAVAGAVASATSSDVKVTYDYASAVNRLAAGLKNTNTVQQAVAQTNAVQAGVWKDTSKAIDDTTKKVDEARDQYDRAKDAVEKHTARMVADKDAVGLGVGAQEEFRAKAQLTTAAIQAGIPITAALTAEIDKLAAADGKAAQDRAQALAQNKASFDLQTVFMSDIDKQIASVQQQLHGNAWPQYMTDGLAATMRLADSYKTLKGAAETFAGGLAKDLANGVPAIQALQSALKTLASSLIDSAVKNLVDQALSSVTSALSGAAAGAGQAATMAAGATSSAGILTAAGTTVAASIIAGATEAAAILGLTVPTAAATLPVAGAVTGTEVAAGGVAAGAALTAGGVAAGAAIWGPLALLGVAIAALGAVSFLGGDDELKKAQDAWKGMTKEVTAFNNAAKGFDLGPLTSEVNSLISSVMTLQKAAYDAHDYAAVASLGDTFNKGLLRVTDEFVQGAQTLTPLQQSMKDLNDEAAGLEATFNQYGFGALAAAIDAALPARLAALTAAFKAQTELDLNADINTANGVGYLNDIATAVQKFNDLSAEGVIDPNLLNNWLKVSVQKIVDDAGLVGSAITDITNLFPVLAGAVTDSASAIADAAAAAAAAATQAATAAAAVLTQIYTESVAAVSTAQGNVTTAQGNLNSAYDAASSALQTTIDKTKTWVQSLRDLSESFKLNSQLSALSPEAQYLEAQSRARADAALAAGGDADAQSRLQGDLTDYLNQSKSFNASTEAYYRDFQEVQNILQSSAAAGDAQVSVAQQQLNALNAQVSGLVTINNSVLSVAAAISALQGAQAGLSSAQAAQTTAQTGLAGAVAAGGLATGDQVTALYNGVLGRAPDAAGAAYWTGLINNGLTGADLVKTFTQASIASSNNETVNPQIRAMYGLANGGMVGNGMWGVDSVVARYAGGGDIALAGGEYVMPAAQTARYAPQLDAMRSGQAGNDNGDWKEVARALAQSNSHDTDRLSGKIDELIDAINATPEKNSDATRRLVIGVKQRAGGKN